MGHFHLLFPKILLAVLLAAMFCACESQLVLESRMNDVVGEYRLETIGGEPALVKRISQKYEQELAAISIAKLFPHEGDWIFDYTIPIISGEALHFHHIQQRIVWDRQLGGYYFDRLQASDLPSGWDPDKASIKMEGRTVEFSGNDCVAIWYKFR